jgi:predicted amidohydrolase YtcJ
LWALAGEGQPPGKAAMTPFEALRASTREAAQKIGFLPDIGTVETGKLADLVVFDADPLADIHNSVKIRWVIKNGELFDAATLTRRWPSEHPLPRMFWQEAP